MEIVESTKGREGRDKEFKIDLIVWKLESSNSFGSVFFMFKIDLIV